MFIKSLLCIFGCYAIALYPNNEQNLPIVVNVTILPLFIIPCTINKIKKPAQVQLPSTVKHINAMPYKLETNRKR